jgi:hypothetical protein
MNKRGDPSIQESRVGIFWLLKNGKLVFDFTPLAEAEPYGDFLTHRRGHLEQWEILQARGFVPGETEYEELPRGRVVYNRKAERFTVLADRCILARPESVKEIFATMKLPADRMDLDTDSHYRCAVCLSRPHLV